MVSGRFRPCSGRACPLKTCWFLCATVYYKAGAGPDQWAGPEVRYMPEAAVRVFLKLTQDWEACGCLPQQLKQARRITLCKEGKMEPEGHLHVKHTRPITVMSCFWRVYASCWARHAQLGPWLRTHLHESVAYGRGAAGAEDLIGRLQDSYAARKGCLASLDWAAAYDRMKPQVSARFMEALGLPRPLTTLMLQAWGQQRRFVQFEGHTHEVALALEAGAATPQGCPLAPMVLSLWGSSHRSETRRLLSAPIWTTELGTAPVGRLCRDVFKAGPLLVRPWDLRSPLRRFRLRRAGPSLGPFLVCMPTRSGLRAR